MIALKKENAQAFSEQNTCVAVFETHQEAEDAVKKLEKSCFDMKRLSIVGKDYRTEEQVVGYYNMSDRVKFWGEQGAFWGSLWGVLLGSGFFFIPGIGPIVLAGPIVSMLIGGLEGAIALGGLSAIGATLYSMGIPRDTILNYEMALKARKFLLIAHGTPHEVDQAHELLKTAGVEGVTLHKVANG